MTDDGNDKLDWVDSSIHNATSHTHISSTSCKVSDRVMPDVNIRVR